MQRQRRKDEDAVEEHLSLFFVTPDLVRDPLRGEGDGRRFLPPPSGPARIAYRTAGAEVHQQRLLTRRPDAGHLVQRARADRLRALVAMRPDHETVDLVAQPLEVEQHRRIDRQLEFAPVEQVEHLAPLTAVVRPLGDTDQAHVLNPQILQHRLGRAELRLAAVDQHQVGPGPVIAVGRFLQLAGEAAAEDLAHHADVAVGRRLISLDVPLAILALAEPLRPRDDHRAHGVAALDVAVVVDFDPVGRVAQVEQLRHLPQQPGLRRALRQPPLQRLDRIALGLVHQPAPVAALRHRQRDLVSRALAQRLAQQRALAQLAVEQDRLGRWHFLVELGEEARQHLILGHVVGVLREEAAMPPILATADEEGLDADHPVFARQSEDVGIAHALRIDRLRALHERQRLQPVAQQRGQFEVHIFRRRLHLRAELGLHLGRLAGQEVAAVVDQFLVPVLVDPPDARCRAALDLLRSRNSFCSAFSVLLTLPALANGP
ncbi:hypothetical protein WR25_02400 [Diploscapter pachys]|uniref:Uncharacterized protein n=1 Tax=Diploscapter pachys TaxID=2018661 RepID=A0A2A2KHK5_9BILA|nr:hypothetical protein WR25_02400 [Diploscapter pachys]